MDLNVKAPFFLTQALYPLLKAAASQAQPAKVINIGSIDGIRLNPWETYSYHASKAGDLSHQADGRGLIKDQINVTSIAPGAFASDMNRAARDHGDAVAKRIPNSRLGTAEDMAAAAIFLASNAGNYVVGDTITVDGGVAHANISGRRHRCLTSKRARSDIGYRSVIILSHQICDEIISGTQVPFEIRHPLRALKRQSGGCYGKLRFLKLLP